MVDMSPPRFYRSIRGMTIRKRESFSRKNTILYSERFYHGLFRGLPQPGVLKLWMLWFMSELAIWLEDGLLEYGLG
jgi:hypothetical protein